MTPVTDRTVLITGSNSGIGFEAAAQLAEVGWGKMWEMLDVESSLVADQKLAEDGSFLVEGLEAGVYTMIVMTVPHTLLFEQFSYVYRSVTVSDSQETHVILGPDFVTEHIERTGD